MGWQFWIDRGGTFTDLIGVSPQGEQIIRKVLSESPDLHSDPTIIAIKEVLNLKKRAVIPEGLIDEIRLGTTVATNALLEGKGNPVLLFCNRGLKDLLKIGDQHRTGLFELKVEHSQFLASNVIEVSGRINAKSEEVEPLVVDKKLESKTLKYSEHRNHSCAIALLNAYKNPKHELQLKAWLATLGFRNIICSHQVSSLPGLVSRGQTTLVEANVSPVLFDYLQKLTNELGISTHLRVMGSNGGLLDPKYLLAKDTILSGPAGGMVGAVSAAKNARLKKKPLIGFDMGGTSTDVFYVPPDEEFDWEHLSETEIAGQRLMAHRLPIHTIAAGGGSVIYSDSSRLRVGPRSAGSNPGPASYGKGGPLTITDANLLLGRIQTKDFPAVFGSTADKPLDASIVETKFNSIAKNLLSSPEHIAEGAINIAVERMADAIKKVSVFCGYDIRKGVLIAFGGAGGQHACRLAKKLSLMEILIPPLTGVLSAYGVGIARQKQIITKNLGLQLNARSLEQVKEICKANQYDAERQLFENTDFKKALNSLQLRRIAFVEIRYQSSDQGLMVQLDSKSTTKTLIENFEAKHLQRFGYIPPRNEVLVFEKIEVEVSTSSGSSFKALIKPRKGLHSTHRNFSKIYLPECGWTKVPCYKRDHLVENSSIEGPALIVESTSSVILESDWIATVQEEGSLLIRTKNQKPKELTKSFTKNVKADPVLLELFHHRFSSIAEKMGERLRQTSRSINIRERLDFSCAIFDQKGELVANAPHIPVHLGSMGESITNLLNQISANEREPLRPFETILTNDPFNGGTHLPDITAITPVFAGSKDPLYFVASRGHHADVGGLTPGSMPPFSKTIHEEGLLLHNERFISDGTYDRISWEKRIQGSKFPPRNPAELIADLHAQVAANQLGISEIEQLVADVGQEEVSMYMKHLQSNASVAVQNLLKRLESTNFSVELDNGAKLHVDIIVDNVNYQAKLDFSQTSSQGWGNFQAPLAITKSAVLYVFRCLLTDDIPLNSGCFKPLELIVPKGSLLNPITPAAVVAGNVETSQALCNLLFGALGVLSASQGTMNNLTFGDKNNQYYETIAGGSGAGNGFNGEDGIQTHMTNSRLTDPEIIEQRYPVQIELFEIRQGSGGKGQWHGGNGLLRKFRFLEPMTVSILSGSRRIAPFGLKGGLPGAVGVNQLELRDGTIKKLEGCASLKVRQGEAISIATPGGGGYGKSINRQRKSISKQKSES